MLKSLIRGKFIGSRSVNNPPEHFVNNQVLTVGIGPYAVRTNSPKDFWFCCCMLQPLRRFAPASLYQSSISSVPPTTATRPAADFFVSFSWNTRHENRIVTRMLSLSMGATTLAGPSCRAL